MKRVLTFSAVSAFLTYLLFSFGNAGFDINLWSVEARGLCAFCMFVSILFGGLLSKEKVLWNE